MYDATNIIIAQKTNIARVNIINTMLSLANVGYEINNRKKDKLNYATIINRLARAAPLFDKSYINDIETFYNKFTIL